jgi:hypothetical protein
MTETKKSSPYLKNLRAWNIVAAVLHAAQGVALLLLASDFSVPLTTMLPGLGSNPGVPVAQYQTETTIQVAPLVAAFFFLSAAAHAITSLPGVYERYVVRLKQGINYYRWVEYSLSASIMIVTIGLICGITDMPTLLCLFFLNASMILFGWMMERHNQTTKTVQWDSFIFGCIAGLIPWVVIAWYFFTAAARIPEVPDFVPWIVTSLFLFFNIFAINQYLQYKRIGKWKDYIYGERAYIVLSLVAKSLLAWQVFSGTLR